jgi:16S rRNA processing protein RimM
MSATSAESVVVGQICAPYGVKGWMHVRSFTMPETNLENFSTWQIYLKDVTKSKSVKVEQFKIHNDHFVAKLMDIENRDTAATFTNWNIAIKRELLPELAVGEYYLTDLLGMVVYNKDGNILGKVTDFLSTGANDILIIRDGDKEYLIPCVFGIYILEVCLNKKEIKVAWDTEF